MIRRKEVSFLSASLPLSASLCLSLSFSLSLSLSLSHSHSHSHTLSHSYTLSLSQSYTLSLFFFLFLSLCLLLSLPDYIDDVDPYSDLPDLLDDDDEDEFEYPPKSRRKARRGYRVDTLTTDDYRWRVGILTINERELPQQITMFVCCRRKSP